MNRTGNRARIKAAPGAARVPPPPKDLDPLQRRLWLELAADVESLGTFSDSDRVAFRQLVRSVARAEACPLDAAPSAAARLEQIAASALSSFGLTPASRSRVSAPPPPPSPELDEFLDRR